jgi:uncharacterized membrane protein
MGDLLGPGELADRRYEPRWLRFVRNHARLFGSMAIGGAGFVVLELAPWPPLASSPPATRILLAWDLGVIVYLALAYGLISRFDVALARRRASIQDEGGLALMVLTVAAAVASVAAIVAELGSVPKDHSGAPYFALAVTTITLSWTFVHVILAVHYAHEFYDEGAEGGGLQFPADDQPDYWDFVYFSFVIGMTCQVSDVQVTGKRIRRIVLMHGIVSFVFNVAILALVVNLGAGLI